MSVVITFMNKLMKVVCVPGDTTDEVPIKRDLETGKSNTVTFLCSVIISSSIFLESFLGSFTRTIIMDGE